MGIILSFIISAFHSFDIKGYIIAMFLLAAVACESVIGLGLVINLFRKLKTALWFFLKRLRR
jgi:NADH:ubiquinone oxidoreductase subunit K